jgi:hypothetical protein
LCNAENFQVQECCKEFNALTQEQKNEWGFEYNTYQFLRQVVNDCDRKINRQKHRIRAEAQSDSSSRLITSLTEEDQTRWKDIEQETNKLATEAQHIGSENSDADAVTALFVQINELGHERNALVAKAKAAANIAAAAASAAAAAAATAAAAAEQGEEAAAMISPTPVLVAAPSGLQVTGTTRKLVVCIVSGNFMSTTDGKDRLEGHFSGKQYQGWKKIRGLVKDLETKRLKPGTKRMTRSGGSGARVPHALFFSLSSVAVAARD